MREMTGDDRPALCAIMQDAGTMYAYEGPFSDAEVDAWIASQFHRYDEVGYGLWAVVLRETGEVIGQCGLTWQDIDGSQRLEVGYLFNRRFWHQGFALEAARACRDLAFRELGADEVYAKIRDTNLASMNVAIRLGMTIRCRFMVHYRGVDMPHYGFVVKADNERHLAVINDGRSD